MAGTGTIGDYLQEDKRDRGWSTRQFGDEVGVSSQQVSKWIRGVDVPGEEHTAALARALQRTEDEVAAAMHKGRTERRQMAQLQREVKELRAEGHEVAELIDQLVSVRDASKRRTRRN